MANAVANVGAKGEMGATAPGGVARTRSVGGPSVEKGARTSGVSASGVGGP